MKKATNTNNTTINTYTLNDKHSRMWDTDTTLSLGAGYKKGNFMLDGVVRRTFFQEGVGSNGIVSQVNATYLLP